jgi:NAD(P)-dependent dehydrogenase (short-subunit alcohol dehydrogenase family)
LAAGRNYSVAVNYFSNAAGADEVVRYIKAQGGHALAIQADVSEPDEVARLFATTISQLGKPTALVNNAAEPGERRPIDQIEPEMLRRILAVTLAGPILCIAEATRCMSTARGGRGGAIVNLSSQAARTGGRLLTPYVGAKAGIEAVTLGLARELGPVGIRINAVSPGLIATESLQHGGKTPAHHAQEIPLGRLGRVDEVAEAIVWLMSPSASYITGTVVGVNGGR